MINRDAELTSCARNGEVCNFLKSHHTEIAEISAQRIRQLLLDPDITSVRIRGAIISGELDLRDTLSAKKSPIGGLELIDCVILKPMHLERSHLSHLSLLKSACVELHAQNCRIEGDVDLGYVYSSEEPESRAETSNESSEFIKNIFQNSPALKELIRIRTGIDGPEKWWEYEVAMDTSHNPEDYSARGRCQVDLSEAFIGGSLHLDGCRLVAEEIQAKTLEKCKEEGKLISDPSNPALKLTLSRIDGDCLIRGQMRSNESIVSPISGAFLGKIDGRNMLLGGDFWGCEGIYWGYFEKAIFFQGVKINGGTSFQRINTNRLKESKAIIRGELNFFSAQLNSCFLTNLTLLHSVFCLNDGKDFKTNNLINAADVLIKNRFSLQIDNKEIINERQVFDLRSIKIGADLWIDIKNYNAANDPTDQFYLIRSSEINGDFNLSGDIEGDIDARNLHVNGSCYINAIIRNTIDLSGLVVKDDVEFYPTIYGTADLSSIHVRGSLFLSQNYERYNEINSLKFVQKTTPEDKHKFIELQNNKEEFLNHCFNNPLCSLILKRAVIEKELRIHQLTIDLGNFDPNRIYWRERFREFFRKLVRFTIRIVKCLPGKLSPYGQVKLRVILDRLHGISAKRVKIIQCSDKLSFYPGYRWLRCYVEQTVYDHHARGVVNCLWNSSTKKLVILDGKSTPIHELNHENMLTLETDDQVKDYLRFFCECVWNETQGPFHIYEIAHEFDNQKLSTHAESLKIIDKNENENEWKITAKVIYANKLFEVKFLVRKNGGIDMQENEPIEEVYAESYFDYETPYQYLLHKPQQDQNYAEAALKSFRPMHLKFNSPLS